MRPRGIIAPLARAIGTGGPMGGPPRRAGLPVDQSTARRGASSPAKPTQRAASCGGRRFAAGFGFPMNDGRGGRRAGRRARTRRMSGAHRGGPYRAIDWNGRRAHRCNGGRPRRMAAAGAVGPVVSGQFPNQPRAPELPTGGPRRWASRNRLPTAPRPVAMGRPFSFSPARRCWAGPPPWRPVARLIA